MVLRQFKVRLKKTNKIGLFRFSTNAAYLLHFLYIQLGVVLNLKCDFPCCKSIEIGVFVTIDVIKTTPATTIRSPKTIFSGVLLLK